MAVGLDGFMSCSIVYVFHGIGNLHAGAFKVPLAVLRAAAYIIF